MKKIFVPLIICLFYSVASSWWLSGDSVRTKIKMKMHKHAASKLLFVNPSDSLVDTSEIYYDGATDKTRFPSSIYFDPSVSAGIYIDTSSQVFFISFAATGPDSDSGAYIYMEGDDDGGDLILSPGVSGDFTVHDNIIIDNGASYSDILTGSGATCTRLTLWPYGITNGGAFHLLSGSGDSINSVIESPHLEIRDKGSGDLSLSFDDFIYVHTDLFKVLGPVEIRSGNVSLTIGADASDTSLTDDTNKEGVIASPIYDTDEEDACGIFFYNDIDENRVNVGGDGSLNAPTSFSVYTAANNTTLGGTERFEVNNVGNLFAYNLATGVGGETDLVINGSDEILLKSSSKRYKKNIKTVNLNSSALQKFKVYEFTWNKSGKEDFGFIAEELAKNFPGIETYVDGKIQSWDTQKMVILCVAEIQRLNKTVEYHKIFIIIIYGLSLVMFICFFCKDQKKGTRQ